MTNISISKKDYIWSYIAQLFSMGAGIIVLPIILKLLSTDEIALNYLMLTIASLVSLFDFGFAPQFGRNISYIFGGVQELHKDGIVYTNNSNINYTLLATMIKVAKNVYSKISFLVLLIMLTFGTLYIYIVTKGFETVKYSLIIWIIFSISTYFNIYFIYYSSLLTGSGKIMESKKAILFSKLTYLFLAYSLLFHGLGLLGLVIANLISPFVNLYFSSKYFYDKELRRNLIDIYVSKKDIHNLFIIIWYNSKKLGLVYIGSYCTLKFSIFLAGFFLSSTAIASYGLMMQLVTLIGVISGIYYTTNEPLFAELMAKNNKKELVSLFASSMFIYYSMFIIGSILLLTFGPSILIVIGSNAYLPSQHILIIYMVITLIELNCSYFSTFIVIGNKIPFVNSALITGAFIVIFSFISLRFTTFGILGLIIVQGICQGLYNSWRWPLCVLTEFKLNFIDFLLLGIIKAYKKLGKPIITNYFITL